MKSEFQGVNTQTGAAPSKKWIRDDVQNKLTQNKILVDALKCLPVCQIYVPDTECDDIIGYVIRSKLKTVDAMKIIVSSDRDFYQLLDDPNVKIFNPADKCLHTGPIIKVKVSSKEHIDIPARNYALIRTLTGDASDNIEGVPGMGFKTAVKLFPGLLDPSNDYTIQNLTEVARSHLNDKKALKAWASIASSEEVIQRNWRLMFLGTGTLSYNQVTKIDYVIDNFEPKANKLLLIKTLLGAQIVSDINYDSLISQMQLSLLFE
jgi:5'-3' exonuclease